MNEVFTRNEALAVKELEILQSIIARQDNLKAKCKGLAVTIFSALSVAFLDSSIFTISAVEYVLVSVVLSTLFVILESLYGITELNAESRVVNVELFLSEKNHEYDGPAISSSLRKRPTLSRLLKAARRERTYYVYAALVIISVLLACYP